MPKGMRLKSEGFASSLYDPDSTFTLASYCKEKSVPYADTGLPVPLETFSSYGIEFQRRFVPQVEEKMVVSLQRCARGFRIQLDDGEVTFFQKVVVAVGLSHFAYVPPMLRRLPDEFVSHSSDHPSLDHFKGREVTVVGAGASALDIAALLHQAGVLVQVVARKPFIHFHDPPNSRTRLERLRRPMTGIGPGWRLFLCANAPWLFRHMPERFRLDRVRKILGPAPGWFIKEQVVGKVPLNVGMDIIGVNLENGRVKLELKNGDAGHAIKTDHVIAATGYRVDLRRLPFIDKSDLEQIRSVEHTPVLSPNFESSVPGMYFVGTAAANSFGPLLRFAFGAKFTANRVSRHLANTYLPKVD
jgi:cation diffusion facilitator CzcD-associated flavoprotein CzcO